MSKNEFICDFNIIHENTVNETISKMPEEDVFNNITEFFKILGDTTLKTIKSNKKRFKP